MNREDANLLWKLYESEDADHRKAGARWDNDRERIVSTTRKIIATIGSVGPENLEGAVGRALSRIKASRRFLYDWIDGMDGDETEDGELLRETLRQLAQLLDP